MLGKEKEASELDGRGDPKIARVKKKKSVSLRKWHRYGELVENWAGRDLSRTAMK